MKKIYILLFSLLAWVPTWATQKDNTHATLSGKITNNMGEAIIGATVYFPELKAGITTDTAGCYSITQLPRRIMLIQISALGYQLLAENIDLKTIQRKDAILNESVVEINEVVVTGQSGASQMTKMPSPMSIITQKELQQQSGSNLIDAISSQPGISQISTGSGISKPIIRGLGYNRVVVINDGVRQEGQQWGDEHGIEIDENEVYRVEILKGPASLMYGSDALAGVINFISTPSLSQGKMRVNAMANYQTNNGLMAYSLNFAGHKKAFIWDLRYSNKQAHSYHNRYDGYVYNAGFKENAASALAGWTSWWGYSHLNLSVYQLKPGIVEGERDSASGQFIKPLLAPDGSVTEAITNTSDLKSYNPSIPYQQVKHYKAVWSNNILLGKGSLKLTAAYQQNRRQEFADIVQPNNYELYFQLHTLNYDIHYLLPLQRELEVSFGVNGMYQQSLNKGIEFLVPEYRLFDAGLFLLGKKSWGNLNVSAGLRYDKRTETTDALYLDTNGDKTTVNDLSATQRFGSFSGQFGGVSASVGATYQLSDNWNTKLNLARGFRAPNISELGSNGVHEGTVRYELGNPSLTSENSLQVDYELGYATDHVNTKINLFANKISNYIFSRKLTNSLGADSIMDGVSAYKFDAGNAFLMGAEAYIDIHPHPWDWLHFQNSFAFVNAQLLQQTDSSKYLPTTPPAKWKSDIRIDINKVGKLLKNGYFSVGLEHFFSQNNIYSAYGTETTTPAYTLLNASIGGDISYHNTTLCSLYINATNLADIAYQSHLSRLKYAPTNFATGRTGVYNMGRNISIKLIVPVEF